MFDISVLNAEGSQGWRARFDGAVWRIHQVQKSCGWCELAWDSLESSIMRSQVFDLLIDCSAACNSQIRLTLNLNHVSSRLHHCLRLTSRILLAENKYELQLQFQYKPSSSRGKHFYRFPSPYVSTHTPRHQQPLFSWNKKSPKRRKSTSSSVFSCRQHWKSSRKPPESGCQEVNKTCTSHCCYPCCEYLRRYWKNWIQISPRHALLIVSIPSPIPRHIPAATSHFIS